MVPPELNLNENAEPPLENVPVEPNGLVRVIIVMVHTIFYRISEVGNLTLIFDALGIE